MLNESNVVYRDALSARPFSILSAGDLAREAAEELVKQIYHERYGAQVAAWMPHLAARTDGSRILAVAGFRSAAQPLYLEHYLERPVEQVLAERLGQTGRAVARESMVEVGHLASRRAGQGAVLLLDLAEHLRDSGFEWLLSTATADARRLMLGLRAAPLVLGPADPSRLPDAGTSWGTYYAHAPLVLAVHLPTALSRRKRAEVTRG